MDAALEAQVLARLQNYQIRKINRKHIDPSIIGGFIKNR
jgi:hypothetical protein